MPLTPGPTHTIDHSTEVAIASPGAIALAIDVPAQLGEDLGVPPFIYGLGRANVGTAAGWLRGFDLEHAEQLLWPLPPSCTRLGITIAPGVSVVAQEFVGDLEPGDCADELAALQSALDARDVIIADQTASIADLEAQLEDCQSAPAPPSGPIITNVGSTSTPTTLTVTWDTDLPSDSQVEYGATTSYGQLSALQTALVTSHSVTVTGLTPNATYHWRPKSAAPIGTSGGDHSDTLPADPTLLYQQSLTAPSSGANSVWDAAANIPQASYPIIVTVKNDAAAGGGALSGPVLQCMPGPNFIAGGFGLTQNPGATWSSGNLSWAAVGCTGTLRVIVTSDAAHAIPWTVTVRKAS